ncbi:pilus assembly protein PilM [Candidatus Nitrosoglobus terrae]
MSNMFSALIRPRPFLHLWRKSLRSPSRKFFPLLGIDISTSAVKLLELSQVGDRTWLKHYTIESLPPSIVVDNKIEAIEDLSQVLKKIIKRSGIQTKKVATAIPSSAAITKVISVLANLSGRELEVQVELEAEQYIPYPLDEVNLDFEVLGPSAKDPEAMEVLLVACRKEYIDARVAALVLAGLTPTVVDIDVYGIERALMMSQGEEKTIVVADMGAVLTTIHVLHDHKVIYTREQLFGGNRLTEEIQRHYDLSYEKAHLAKRYGGLPENYIPDILEPFKQAVAQHIKRELQFFFSSTHYHNIDHIVLTGGCASIQGIDKLVESVVEISTVIANPFMGMALASGIDANLLRNDAPALVVACGLALRGLD